MKSQPEERSGLWIFTQNLLTLAVVALGVIFNGQWDSSVAFWSGCLLFAAGGAIGISGVRALGTNRRSHPAPKQDGTLVETGVYRIVRHPLYASLILAGGGWSLIWSSTPAAGATVALAILLNFKAITEERMMSEKFPAYEAYKKRVGRLFPKLF